MTGERGKVWYGAVAFWAVVVALLAARVMLLDVDTLRSYAAKPAPASEFVAETASVTVPARPAAAPGASF
jgi:hypothetical protein